MVSETSHEAHREEIISGRKQNRERKIWAHLMSVGGDRTRNEIATELGMRLSSVCGGVDVLLRSGLATEGLPRPDRYTGRKAKPLYAIGEGGVLQRRFSFDET